MLAWVQVALGEAGAVPKAKPELALKGKAKVLKETGLDDAAPLLNKNYSSYSAEVPLDYEPAAKPAELSEASAARLAAAREKRAAAKADASADAAKAVIDADASFALSLDVGGAAEKFGGKSPRKPPPAKARPSSPRSASPRPPPSRSASPRSSAARSPGPAARSPGKPAAPKPVPRGGKPSPRPRA
jgi:hypothetical protein